MSGLLSIGIDNGLFGAVVAVDDSYHLVDYRDTPTLEIGKKGKTKNEFATSEMGNILRSMISKSYQVIVWIEQAHSMPAQGVSSTFKTGRGFGLWEGICIGLGVTYDIVHPKTWTKVVLMDMPAGDPKARSMAKCQRLFPTLSLMKPNGRKLSLDGRADAALIAYYGMSKMRGFAGDISGKKDKRKSSGKTTSKIEKRPPPKRG